MRNLEESAILGSDLVRLRVLELVLSKEDWTMLDPYAVLRGWPKTRI